MGPTKFGIASTQCPSQAFNMQAMKPFPLPPKSCGAPGSPGSARQTSGSRSPQLCHWGRSTGSPVHDLEEQEGEKRVMAVLHIAGSISLLSQLSLALEPLGYVPVDIPWCSFSLYHVYPAPSPLNLPWAWVHPYKDEDLLGFIQTLMGQMVVFTPLWINMPVESESSGWIHAQSQAALSTHCSQILAPLGWWYCSGGLDVVGIWSLHPSKSPSLQSACSSCPGTWSSLPHSFAGLKHTEEGWKGVGACVWKLSTHLLAAHAPMAWDNTWWLSLKSTPWHSCL